MVNLIKKLSQSPHQLFLMDGIGALFSALLLGGVLAKYHTFIGIPPETLFFLAAFPVLYVLYDVYCYRTMPDHVHVKIKGVVGLNLLYTLISIGVLVLFKERLTAVAYLYFSLELMVIFLLVLLELKVLKQLN